MRTLFDTLVLVPALVDQLGNHRAAFQALHRSRTVMTGGTAPPTRWRSAMRPSPRCRSRSACWPEEARALVEESIRGRLSTIEVMVDDYLEVLRQVARLGLASGAVYDALHVRCGRKAAVDRILTYNVTHFETSILPASR